MIEVPFMPRLQLFNNCFVGLSIWAGNEWNEGGIASYDSSLIGDGSFLFSFGNKFVQLKGDRQRCNA
ncbi:hypothetical protein DFQ01_14616 [Paenibacillus cellulosilyticus]|uniref:Uncharacterized protein n=1 Tax=Paenibacillus cellulosilyticus TaxID=375489 RepID=A0A2V2YES9_9BACL|nr:hypothetical protein DFQ01_14616 [Paenibacillus cellulosilyticus]